MTPEHESQVPGFFFPINRFPRPSLAEWLCLVAGLYLTFHYFWFMDDAYVYFRYVDNFVHLGLGLVYNHGEFVEGYSSPFWALLLSALRFAGLDFQVITLGIGSACVIFFWACGVIVNRSLSPDTTRIVNFPLLFLMLNYAVLSYFTSGLETPLVQASAAAYALFALYPASGVLQILLGFTPVIRPEFAVPFAIAMLWAVVRTRKIPWLAVGTSLIAVGGWEAFRVYYYADLFPNTFYLKNETNYAQGLVYLWDTFGPYHVVGLTLFVAGMGALAKWIGGDATRLSVVDRFAILAMAGAVGFYSIKIGGDPRHYRYLAFPLCLGVMALGGLPEHLLEAWAVNRDGPRVAALLKLVRYAQGPLVIGGAGWISFKAFSSGFPNIPSLIVLYVYIVGVLALTNRWIGFRPALIAGLAWISLASYPRQLNRHPFGFEEGHREIEKINDASVHRDHTQLNWAERERLYEEYGERHPEFVYESVLESGYCGGNYMAFYQQIVQWYGLTEPVLARTEMKSDRTAHKEGLKPLANHLRNLYESYEPERGRFRRAVDEDAAEDWVEANLATLELIERKMFNRHDWRENWELATKKIGRIDLGG